MLEIYKKRGKTPLQALVRLRAENPEIEGGVLSYAGRLDPMAEGILPVLVGEEENKSRESFLKKDKEYEAHFLIGCSTDTGDVLGVIDHVNFKKVDEEKIKNCVEEIKGLKEQKYPWYSSKTVDGIPLFEYARANNLDIERPTKEIKIYSVSDIKIYELNSKELIEQNIRDIEKVEGDFRQYLIIESWKKILEKSPESFQIVSCKIAVSSGTYIRALTEHLKESLRVPVVLEKLVRIRVF